MPKNARSNDEIVLIKAEQVWPFVDSASKRGADISALADRAGMPLDAVLRKNGLIGERSAWRFAGYAAQSLGLENLGYLVAVEHPLRSTGELGGMRLRMAATLGRLLEFFIEDVTYQNNGARYALVPNGDEVAFRREVIFPDCVGRWQTEQYMITVVMQILELCSGANVRPLRLGFASSKEPRPLPDAWSDIATDWGREATEIVIDADLLKLPVNEATEALNDHHHRHSQGPISASDIDYLVDRQIWSGAATLEAAARELGISGSTLKRRLRKNGRTYSEIVRTRRHHWAKQMLSQTDTPVLHIAHALGYRHLSNFTRAFRAKEGRPPSDYRTGLGSKPR